MVLSHQVEGSSPSWGTMSNGIFSGKPRFEGSWIRNHSLSIVLTVILVAQSVAFHFTRLPEWVSEQVAHGEPTALWPAYWMHYSSEWFVSVLADTYGALLLVLLTKWFYEQGSSESKDTE